LNLLGAEVIAAKWFFKNTLPDEVSDQRQEDLPEWWAKEPQPVTVFLKMSIVSAGEPSKEFIEGVQRYAVAAFRGYEL
jgi:hypothetical protein